VLRIYVDTASPQQSLRPLQEIVLFLGHEVAPYERLHGKSEHTRAASPLHRQHALALQPIKAALFFFDAHVREGCRRCERGKHEVSL
jgi:hypothetical protein